MDAGVQHIQATENEKEKHSEKDNELQKIDELNTQQAGARDEYLKGVIQSKDVLKGEVEGEDGRTCNTSLTTSLMRGTNHLGILIL